MKKIYIIFYVLLFIFSFFLQLLGLMKIVPLYITSPILFFSLFFLLFYFNNRKDLKGFN